MRLTEAKITLPAREVDADIIKTLTLFQRVLDLVVEYYHQKPRDRRGNIGDLNRFRELRKKVAAMDHIPYVRPIKDQIDQLTREFINKRQSQRKLRSGTQKPQLNSSQLVQAWQTHNWEKITRAGEAAAELTKLYQQTSADPLAHTPNPLYIENPLFFISARFLEVFELDQIELVRSRDLSEFRFTHMPLPPDKLDEFEYVAFFMLNLRNTADPREVSGVDARKYFDLAYSGSDYEQLAKQVEKYLYNNDHSLIPGILDAIEKFPEIKKLNDAAKEEIKTVYRGVGGFDNLNDVYAEERKRQFVATSTSQRVAERFAKQIGHLESDDNRRTEKSIVLKYKLTPDAILLDTTIFGGAFGEGEILIDVKRAMLEDYDYV